MTTRDENGRFVSTSGATSAPAQTSNDATPAHAVDDVVTFRFADPITGAVLDGRGVVLEVTPEHVVVAQLVNGAVQVPADQVTARAVRE